MRSILLALFFAAISSVDCSSADTKVPSDTFGELFEKVQLQKVFPDGKTFVDATPNESPEKNITGLSKK